MTTCRPSCVTRSSRRSFGPRWRPARPISRLWSAITWVLTGPMSALWRFGRHGSFNVAVPVLIQAKGRWGNERVYVRFPLPYKVGETEHPGNVEEKLRTEKLQRTYGFRNIALMSLFQLCTGLVFPTVPAFQTRRTHHFCRE
ncbi:hypothetical protein VTK56DRAFT_215 [Thermocarpiscus australiensis]